MSGKRKLTLKQSRIAQKWLGYLFLVMTVSAIAGFFSVNGFMNSLIMVFSALIFGFICLSKIAYFLATDAELQQTLVNNEYKFSLIKKYVVHTNINGGE